MTIVFVCFCVRIYVVSLVLPDTGTTCMVCVLMKGIKRGCVDQLDIVVHRCLLFYRCDSVMALTKYEDPQADLVRFREYIVYDRRQAYPEFLIEYDRVK